MAHATNNISANLHDVLKVEKEQIRGITVVSLLSGFGRLFADGGQAARDDPHGTFAHSHPVESLDWFVSHSWRSPRAVKLLGLLLHFNRRDAATACAFATPLVCVAETLYFESLPPWLKFTGPNTFTDFSEIELGKGCAVVGYVTLIFFLFGAHVVRQALGGEAGRVLPRRGLHPAGGPRRKAARHRQPRRAARPVGADAHPARQGVLHPILVRL